MADPNEPKKDTVGIVLPPQPVAKPPGTNTRSRETVRIQVPPRQPSNKAPLRPQTQPVTAPKPFPKAVVPPPPPPPSAQAPSTVPASKPATVSPPAPASVLGLVSAAPESISPGPKKETARVPIVPEPPARPAPAVQMKKTQPLIAMPHNTPQSPSIAVAPTEKADGSAMMDAIPMPTCWTLLGVSAVILIIQIWTYFS